MRSSKAMILNPLASTSRTFGDFTPDGKWVKPEVPELRKARTLSRRIAAVVDLQ